MIYSNPILQSLTVITITYNNFDECLNTYESLRSFRESGGSHIIINGGESIQHLINHDCKLVEEPDTGIYDALNKGIALVSTKYFMLIHSGDTLIQDITVLEKLITQMKQQNLDILLNNCMIEFGSGVRYMKSDNWQPWMFNYGAQPPHPPIIYKTHSVKEMKYDVQHRVIADFKYLEDIFNSNLRFGYGKIQLIRMTSGGVTSSGITSYFHVTCQFYKLKGPIRMLWFFIARPLIKLYQMK